MQIMIAGGTGFIGQALCNHFLAKNHDITIIGRDPDKIHLLYKQRVKALTWSQIDDDPTCLKSADFLINLNGESIGEKRWSETQKHIIVASRIPISSLLATHCAQLGSAAPALLNASAIGVYDLQTGVANELPIAFDENTPIDFAANPNFLARVGRLWELATQPAKDAGVRVVNMRFAPVLGKSGGILAKLKLPFSLCMGGPIGSGQQPFSWIAMADVIGIIDFLIEHTDIEGPINFVAPECVTQKQFAQTLGSALNRPSFMPTPKFVLKGLFGEMAEELLLKGQHVKPSRLLEFGYQFQYPKLDLALNEIFTSHE